MHGDPEARRGTERVREKRRFANPWLTTDDEGAALPGSGSVEQPIDRRAIGSTAPQHGSVQYATPLTHTDNDKPLRKRCPRPLE